MRTTAAKAAPRPSWFKFGLDVMKQKILIVDDHPLVREGLAKLFNATTDFAVCGDAGSPLEGVQLTAAARPHVVIAEISMKNGSALEMIKTIKRDHPTVAIVVFTKHEEAVYCDRAFRAGVRGYVTKTEATTQVLLAVRAVLAGASYVSKNLSGRPAAALLAGEAPAPASPVDLLSDRELEVFKLIGQGHSTRQIAQELKVSFKTVQSFCARIKDKLRVGNATDLLREAVRWHESLDWR